MGHTITQVGVAAAQQARGAAQVSWYSLIGCALAGAAVLYSWKSIVPVRAAWDRIDESLFFALNGSLALNETWLHLWVLAGSRLFDVIPGLTIIGCYATLLRQRPRLHRGFLLLQFSWAAVFIWTWQAYIADLVMELRVSPSHVLLPFTDIKHVLEWVPRVKSGSYDCFPGDHASVLVFFCVLFAYLLERRTSLVFIAIAPLFCLPRLMSGAHWLSDIAVGGVACGLIGAAVFMAMRNAYLHLHARRRC